jgi:hypothetical protein
MYEFLFFLLTYIFYIELFLVAITSSNLSNKTRVVKKGFNKKIKKSK